MFHKNKNIYMYLGSRFVSLTGSGIQAIALPLYILDTTASGTWMGILSAFTLVPLLICAPFAGIIGDRKNRRHVMILMDILRGALITILGILNLTNHFSLPLLFSFQIIISILDSLFNASSAAILPDLVSSDQIIEANSLKGGFDAASTILGPILGGMIYGLWGIQFIFIINGVSFFLSVLFTILIQYQHKLKEYEKMNTTLFLRNNTEVLKFIKKKKGLLQLFSFAMLSNFLLVPLFDLIMPYVLKKEIGFTSQQYGYITAALAVGILLGNISIVLYFKRLGTRKLMKYGFIFETSIRLLVCYLLLPKAVLFFGGASKDLFFSIIFLFVIMEGFNAFVNTSISTNLQNSVPADMRSRFFSLLGMLSQGAMPMGTLLFGLLIDKIDYSVILIAINLALALAVILFLTRACNEAFEATPQ